jgi:hypothetical protein
MTPLTIVTRLIALLDDFNDAMRSRVDKNRSAIKDGVAIIANSVFRRNVIIGYAIAPTDTLIHKPCRLARTSSAASYCNPKQEGNQQRSKRRFAGNVAQDTQWHSWPTTNLYRIAQSVDGTLHRLRHFCERGFRLGNRIQAFVDKRWP